MTEISLKIEVQTLIQQQKLNWPLAQKNYAGLDEVEARTFNFDGFKVAAQFNPERIRSSAAKTDAQSISERACFLCEENQPKEQKGIDFIGKYTILVNPFPIFRDHLTISLKKHSPQEIAPYFDDMLQLSKELPEFTIFYNGPKCGASAPDHFHFQAGNKNVIPIDSEMDLVLEKHGELLFKNENTNIMAIGEGYLRKLVVLKSSSAEKLASKFQRILSILNERGQEGEPMLNVLCNYQNKSWNVVIFPRDKQRPTQFYAEGEEQILVSPASVEMGGLVILPRKEDFDKITKEDLRDIYGQVTVKAPSSSPAVAGGGQEGHARDWAWLCSKIGAIE
jgi:hypothetical protein